MLVVVAADSSILAFSAASRSRCSAILSAPRSMPCSPRNVLTRWSMTRWSQSSPPRWLSPEVDLTSMTPSPSSSRETSKVPPPRSKTRTVCSLEPLSRPYARAAAVGSLTMRRTLKPAISPASLVAWRWASLKYAGTVMTASRDLLAEVGLGVALELHQHPRGDLLRGVLLAVDVDGPVGADLPLDRTDRPVGVGHRLTLGDLADQNLAVAREGDDGRGRPGALRVGDDGGLASFQNADAGVRGAEVDADRSCHVRFLASYRSRCFSQVSKLSGPGSMMPRRSSFAN